ncbi:gas vesicle protein [Streptomyces sp. NPDC006332]|uniref:gas vesicle protein GvpO n=1 Tax=Streptomyces sp. NPDC006332 TaxID=3155456 RepID=UPI0033B8E3B7
MSNTRNTSQSQRSQDAPARKPSSEHSPEDTEGDDIEQEDTGRRAEHREAHRRRPSTMDVLRGARAQLQELTGMSAENVSSFEQTEDGWSLEVEVLELSRVPDTMSLMASYQVELDPDGELTGYRRVRRYERGRADAHRQGGR